MLILGSTAGVSKQSEPKVVYIIMGKKNKKSSKILDHEPSVESAADLSGNSTRINSLIGNKAIVAIFLFLISFLVFIPSLSNEFVWDDVYAIKEKASVLDFSRINLEMFAINVKEGGHVHKYFRPVYSVSMILDYEIWNRNYIKTILWV